MTGDGTVVHLAPGEGLVARRPGGVLFAPGGPDPRLDPLLDAFGDPGGHPDAVTDALAAAGHDAPPFAMLTWSTGSVGVVVWGAVEVSTDHPTLPMVSGAGSATWIERRVRTDHVVAEAGAAADAATDLVAGRVRAGGVRARVHAVTPSAPAVTPAAPATDTAHPRDEPPPDPGPVVAPPDPVDDVPPRDVDGLAALRAATGGDWMEESLGLGRPDAPPPLAAVAPVGGTTPGDDDADDEVTLGPDDPVPSPPPPTTPAWPDEPEPDAGTASPSPAPAAAPADRRLVAARRCPSEHPNPPMAAVCRTCGAGIAPSAPTVQVHQPVLARLALPDGASLAVDRTLVLGRRPSADAAGAGADARLVAVGDDAAVSRTHAVVSADGWTITVTDCGSRSGTALVPDGSAEPVVLEPWVPSEVSPGTRIYLGGPTAVHVTAPTTTTTTTTTTTEPADG